MYEEHDAKTVPLFSTNSVELELYKARMPEEAWNDDDNYEDEDEDDDRGYDDDEDEGATNRVEHDEAKRDAKGGVEHGEETSPDRLRS